jgi:hypothetical protein
MTSHKFPKHLRALCAPASVPSVLKTPAAHATLTTTTATRLFSASSLRPQRLCVNPSSVSASHSSLATRHFLNSKAQMRPY